MNNPIESYHVLGFDVQIYKISSMCETAYECYITHPQGHRELVCSESGYKTSFFYQKILEHLQGES